MRQSCNNSLTIIATNYDLMPAEAIISFQNRHQFVHCSFSFLLLLIFLLPFESSAQEDRVRMLKARADSILGADDELVNGTIYLQEHLMANNHPFFLYSDWYFGNITVNGDLFKGVFLKYDIYSDKLILKAARHRGGTVVISLNNEFVDNFRLGDRYFVNATDFRVKGLQTDFVELLYHGNFDFFVGYVKLFNSNYSSKAPYGYYGKTISFYYILQDGRLTRINAKKSLLGYFEPYKKEIKRFMKKNKIKYGKASYTQLHALMHYCDNLTVETVK
ncbi:MAG TPA: hypothetical protein ENJ14_01130 [Bacteroidetes bacterium]|nr:hypothetical protein [Bacteroidota bacterium]